MAADSWLPTPLPTEPAVLTTDGRVAWVALHDGTVLASHDAGRTWTPAPPGPLAAEPLALLATPQMLLAATEGGVFRASEDTGWMLSSTGLPADDLVTMLADAGSGVVAGTLSSGLFRTDADVSRWESVASGMPVRNSRLAIFALAGGSQGLYAAHPLGLSRSRDAGRTWESASFGLPPSVLLNALFVGRAVWASGGGAVFRSDDGISWQSVYARGNARPLVLVASAGSLLVARETDGTRLYRSRDGGITWQSFSRGLPGDTFAIHGVCVEETLLLNTLPAGIWRCDVSDLHEVPAPLELLPQPPTAHGEVAFTVRTPAHVVLSVHDVSGIEVARLVDGTPPPGRHQYQLGSTLPPGLYEWRLTGGGTLQSRSFILIH